MNDVRTLVAKQLGVDIELVTSESRLTRPCGVDLAIEDQFAGVEITDDDVEQISA